MSTTIETVEVRVVRVRGGVGIVVVAGLVALGASGLAAAGDVRNEEPTMHEQVPLPQGARLVARGHLTGAPGEAGPGPHIVWSAYVSPEPVAVVADHFERALRGAERSKRGGSEISWRVAGKSGLRVATAPATASGPWDEGRPFPEGTQSVILISVMVGVPR